MDPFVLFLFPWNVAINGSIQHHFHIRRRHASKDQKNKFIIKPICFQDLEEHLPVVTVIGFVKIDLDTHKTFNAILSFH